MKPTLQLLAESEMEHVERIAIERLIDDAADAPETVECAQCGKLVDRDKRVTHMNIDGYFCSHACLDDHQREEARERYADQASREGRSIVSALNEWDRRNGGDE